MLDLTLEFLKPMSKAIAGAIAGLLVSLAVKWLGSTYTPAFGDAINTIIDVLVPALLGFVIVYFAPKNKDKLAQNVSGTTVPTITSTPIVEAPTTPPTAPTTAL